MIDYEWWEVFLLGMMGVMILFITFFRLVMNL